MPFDNTMGHVNDLTETLQTTRRPVGRPTIYNLEFAERICKLISTTPRGVKKLCEENDWMPNYDTIVDWNIKNEQFSGLYAKAKQEQIHEFAINTLETADKSIDLSQEVDPRRASAVVSAHESKIKALQWYTARLSPKNYGDKISQEISGGDSAVKLEVDKIDLSKLSEEELLTFKLLSEKIRL